MPCRVRILTLECAQLGCCVLLALASLIYGRSDWIGPEFRPLSHIRDTHNAEGIPLVQELLINKNKTPT